MSTRTGSSPFRSPTTESACRPMAGAAGCATWPPAPGSSAVSSGSARPIRLHPRPGPGSNGACPAAYTAVLDPESEPAPCFSQSGAGGRVRDLGDDLLGLSGCVVTPDRGLALVADDEAVLERGHRAVEPGH